jgi:hypothetical protein
MVKNRCKQLTVNGLDGILEFTIWKKAGDVLHKGRMNYRGRNSSF